MKKKKWLPFAIIGGVLFSGLLIAVIIILWSSVFHFAGIVVNLQKEVGNSGQEVLQSQLATGQENTSEPLSGEGDSPESGNKNGRTNIYLGYITGNTYVNDFIGHSYTLPLDWHFATAEERKARDVVSLDNLTKEELMEIDEKVKSTQPTKIMYASNADGSAVTVISLAGFNNLAQGVMQNFDDKVVADNLVNQHIEQYKEYYKDKENGELLSIEKITITVAGEEKSALKMDLILDGVEQYNLIWFYYKDGHMYTVTNVSGGVDIVDSFLPCFS